MFSTFMMFIEVKNLSKNKKKVCFSHLVAAILDRIVLKHPRKYEY